MANQSAEQKKADLIAKMSAERGYLPKPWHYVADHDVDFLGAYNDLYEKSLGNGQALPIKVRELVCIAILCHRGMEGAAADHAKRALKNGATMQELLEAIETMIIPGGAPTFGCGLLALMKVVEDEKKEKEKAATAQG
jgi:alkylhydroperoxidase/carboxymuconolactone decarboxylase family protein YurZ